MNRLVNDRNTRLRIGRQGGMMPALSFKKQFADDVESGKKRQTIRARRKDCRNPQPGQTLYLYTGMRTTSCRKLGEAECLSSEPITIEENLSVIVGCDNLFHFDIVKLSRSDGFDNARCFYDFFRKTHGLPFYGFLIKW